MRYENQAFENETLKLDGNEYIDCTFKDCTMIYAAEPGPGGKIEPLIATGLDIRYEGAAKLATDLHGKVLTEGFSMAPVDSYLRVGGAWFQRIEKPAHLGAIAEKTNGMEVVAFSKAYS